jgi:hypothetical protein
MAESIKLARSAPFFIFKEQCIVVANSAHKDASILTFRRAARVWRLLGMVAALGGLAACNSFKPSHRIIPAPAGAIGAATLGNNTVAVLAGTDRTRGVFILRLGDGRIDKSFGVTREATGIATAGPSGPLLVSVGGSTYGKSFGAVEEWSLDGRKLKVIPTSGAVLGISSNVYDNIAYVLLGGDAGARAAQPINAATGTAMKAIDLEASAAGLQQCKLGDRIFLLYTLGQPSTVALRDLDSGAVVRSTVIADTPSCLESQSNDVFAISRSLVSRGIAVLSLPGLLQTTLVPASNDVVSLYETPDHHLLALNATQRTSNLETFPDDALRAPVKP